MFTTGGTTLGYCAIGRTAIDRPPSRVITMESTMARTGRSMKNLAIGYGQGHSGTPGLAAAVRRAVAFPVDFTAAGSPA